VLELRLDDGIVFVLSYFEDDSLSVSKTNPAENYDEAVKNRFRVCGNCIESEFFLIRRENIKEF